MRHPLKVWIGLGAATLFAACSLTQPLGKYGPPNSESSGEAGADGSTSNECPHSLGGPKLARAGSFCIDSTEVSRSQYQTFLAQAVAGSQTSPPQCAGGRNATFTPGLETPGGSFKACSSDSYLSGSPDMPVGCVDWCDAFAFCAWAGKRLCGAVGGGSVDFDDEKIAAKDQWMAACSKDGTQDFPYGNSFRQGACAESVDADDTDGFNVGSLPDCEGGYPGIYDMSGNYWEWEDSCRDDGAGNFTCHIRGGAHSHSNVSTVRCDSANDELTSYLAANTGFRCCAP